MHCGHGVFRFIQGRLRWLLEYGSQGVHDACGHFALNVEDVGECSVVCLGPERSVLGDVDELGRDPYAVTDPSHASLED